MKKYAEFGNKLRELRKQKGYTQQMVADMFECDRAKVAKWELGERLPKPDMLEQLGKFYNVPIAYLLETQKDMLVGVTIDQYLKEKDITLDQETQKRLVENIKNFIDMIV